MDGLALSRWRKISGQQHLITLKAGRKVGATKGTNKVTLLMVLYRPGREEALLVGVDLLTELGLRTRLGE